jgi:adenosine deaminase
LHIRCGPAEDPYHLHMPRATIKSKQTRSAARSGSSAAAAIGSSPSSQAPSAPSYPNTGLYAELHLHLGGAILPNILYHHMQRDQHALLKRFPTFDRFERFFTRRRTDLADYLKMHKLVESLQRPAEEHLFYYVTRLVRGAYLFDNLAYMELRHTPYNRTDPDLDQPRRIDQMRSIVELIAAAAMSQTRYPLVLRQILCMHTELPFEVNQAIVRLAAAPELRNFICAVDLAGPNHLYRSRIDQWVRLFRLARSLGLRTTAHLYETETGCEPKLLPYLDRIGHGVQIPLRHRKLLASVARRGQCLELCPTTYLRTGTLKDYTDLRDVFKACDDAGVDVSICTDNAGLHNMRLPAEMENLLVRDVINVDQLARYLKASFKHAFAWSGPMPEPLRRLTLPS